MDVNLFQTLPNTCEQNPTALAFHGCQGLFLDGVTSTYSQRNHISINACDGATIKDITIFADSDAPNTDGIDISATKGATIALQSMLVATSYINITDLHCGPGHGISVGSLGRNNAKEFVSNVKVTGAILTDTQNGVRIKTVPGGSGSANQITFSDITMTKVQRPIILTQFYCPHVDPANCTDKPQMVQKSGVTFENIHGTSSTDDAINIHCSKNLNSCVGIRLQNINIRAASPSVVAGSTCKNTNVGLIPPMIPGVNCIRAPWLTESPWDYNFNKSRKLIKHYTSKLKIDEELSMLFR
ncbi:polygalacturonase ADPG2-like [Bidens hawaiensis]|uniref:polygalacturonase ADPG2-like n=1 Tax=Bidens hawaiensis TaxID=980011 RepID=UPI0040499EC8